MIPYILIVFALEAGSANPQNVEVTILPNKETCEAVKSGVEAKQHRHHGRGGTSYFPAFEAKCVPQQT